MKKYENFRKALFNLREGAKLGAPYSVVEQTGIVGLFEICFEQAWKLMKAVLEENGAAEVKIGSPRMVVKLAYECAMIDDCDGWLGILEARNILAHTYSDEQALAVIEKIKTEYLKLFELLKIELDENWLAK